MVTEARLEKNESGLVPSSEGWFVVNVKDAAWRKNEKFGIGCRFEGLERPFSDLGIRVCVIEPGQPNCMYHAESGQEDFLVLQGECLLLVEGREKTLRAWDFFHCPPETEHVFVGAGQGRCIILMVGARHTDKSIVYPVSEVALRHGAGVEKETPDPKEAYAPFPQWKYGRPDDETGLPWSR